MLKYLPLLVSFAALIAVPVSGHAAYTMKVTVSFAAGTAGAKPLAKYPTTTKISPCDNSSTPTHNAATFTVTYDATNSTKVVDRDVYFLLFNPEGVQLPKFFVFKKPNLGSTFNLVPRYDVSELSRTGDNFLLRSENLSTGGARTEVLIGDSISLQMVNSGIWQLIGIVADGSSAKMDFDDPRTWEAWDIATLVLRKPWNGNSNKVCGTS